MADRFVQFASAALEFTRMDANTAAHGREGIPLSDDIYGLLVFPAGNGSHIIGDINTGRTGVLTG